MARTREPHSEEDCDGKRSATRKPRSQEAEKGKTQGRGDRPDVVWAQPPEIDGHEGRSRQEEIARRNATWRTCDQRETKCGGGVIGASIAYFLSCRGGSSRSSSI